MRFRNSDAAAYLDRLTLNPSAALLDQIIAGAISFTNATGAAYDPASVAVFIDNGNVNAASQRIRGADLLFTYDRSLGSGNLGLTLNATYLDSEQQLGSGQAVVPLAGLLFNPPHVRARGGVSWNQGPVTATGNVTYIGGVDGKRGTETVSGHLADDVHPKTLKSVLRQAGLEDDI